MGAPGEAIKIFGHKKLQLIRELALGECTQTALAEKYGVTTPRISQFKTENAEAIKAIRDDINNEFAGLWVADKKNRIAEYQQDIDRINGVLEAGGDLEVTGLRIKHNALMRVAEEMGQLPQKVQAQIETKQVVYKIEGVDPKELT